MSTNSLVDVERSDSIATITLDRPDKLNAVSIDLQRDLKEALEDLTDDPADALVVTGRGDVTCAGMDQDLVTDPDYHEKYHDEIMELNDYIYGSLRTYPNPTVMAAKGAVVGIGFVFSLYCDFVVLGEETHFSLPEIQYGIDTSETISTVEQYVGLRAAKEIAMSGEPVPPEHAHELGLVNEVVPEADVDARAREFAETLTEHDAEILRAMKTAAPIEE